MRRFQLGLSRVAAAAALALVGGSLSIVGGCEVDSFLDPSVIGRWETTPVTVPILERLDIIDNNETAQLQRTNVQPGDLVPDRSEYVVGAGDYLTVTIFELVRPEADSVQNRRVDETGEIRLPVVGPVQASGRTPSQLEEEIRQILEREGVLRDATVSVVLQQSRQNTFSVIGEPQTGGTAIGTYVIPKPDFRLLEAVALARGIPGQTKSVLIFRQTALSSEAGGMPSEGDSGDQEVAPPSEDANQMLNDLLEESNNPGAQGESSSVQNQNQQEDRPAPPPGMESGLDQGQGSGQWIYVDGQFVRAEESSQSQGQVVSEAERDALSEMITQRIIEVPYDELVNGDLKYNIVIRPGDVIKVPSRSAGFVYIMGQINRPGTYTVPGENDLTLKQLVASAGNLSGVAIPERVDLVRRVGNNQEATVRLNLRSIFEGTEPDIFLKPNDLINVGTNFVATPIAVFRNGLRATYGFGFIVDRNFANNVLGDPQ